jgi:hypothetical protein
MIKVVVLRDHNANPTIHIFDPDGREIVLRPDDGPTLVKALKWAYKAVGIPREEWERCLLTGAHPGDYD